ncbi:MAG: IS4 family transposase [Rikenellaceae bacterium]
MGKDRNFTGQPVYNQLLNFVKRAEIEKISRKTTGSEAYVKKLDGYTHLVIMLFGVMKHFDSLRELEIGMKAEAHKLHHLGIDYLARRSTLAEANKRRPQEFFAEVYRNLLHQYAPFLADSRNKTASKEWERLLYMMDSTTISLFDNILKGVGRHPKSGKKKGGMKVHTLMKYNVGVPMVVQLTSAAKHDHYLLKEVHLPKSSILAVDRAYIDIAEFERLSEEGVCYVTKMKKNLKFEVLKSTTYVSADGLVTHKDQNIIFERGELKHYSRRVELWSKDSRKSVVLLTNNFEFSVEDIAEIYKRRWAIETLYKQLKQNFQLHFFYGDSVNAIQIQTWVTLIANLLCTIVSRMIKRRCSFSQVVTMARLMLMYYVDFIAFMEAPDASWESIGFRADLAPPDSFQLALNLY